MSDLDDNLRFILQAYERHITGRFSEKELTSVYPQPMAVAAIKQAFTNAGYITPENAAKVQEMVNQMANLAQDMARVPTIQYVKVDKSLTKMHKLMSGAEWLEAYQQELKRAMHDAKLWTDTNAMKMFTACDDAARKAAGLAPPDEGLDA